MLKSKINLQLFGEGAEGGTSTGTDNAVNETTGENKELASIPEKAKKYYRSQVNSSPKSDKTEPQEVKTTERVPYADLIKGEYAEEHKEYMDRTIGERLKKYKGIEEKLNTYKGLLDNVANKYRLNPNDENYLEILKGKIEADDSFYENYAMEHNITNEEARRVITMERRMADLDAKEELIRKQEEARSQVILLRQNAEKTRAQFPDFDLDKEMQDEKFRRLCAVNNGDTTAAYMACHWNEVIPATIKVVSSQIQEQTAKTVAANVARPSENGLSSASPSVVENNFKNMSLAELRAWADEQRRKK